MNPNTYRRLLMQLVLLPLLGLLALAAGLAYSLKRVESSAAWLDRSDVVIAHANRLVELILDEETGIRGYSLTRNASFLQPYNRARQALPGEFNTAFAMVRDNPVQVENLQRLRQSYLEWQSVAQRTLKSTNPPTFQDMLARKQALDNVRAQADRFFRTQAMLRQHRSIVVNRMDTRARDALVFTVIFVGLLIVFVTVWTFLRLLKLFQSQMDEAARQRDLAEASRLWLHTTIRSIGDGVIACGPTGEVVFMNPVAERLMGWTEEEAKGQPLPQIFQVVNERTRAIVEGPVEKVLRTRGVAGLANQTVLIRKDGSDCPIDDSAAPILDANGQLIGIVLVFRDSTERRNSQAGMMRAERLAAAGKLAASISHQVNNPLEGIANLLYLAGGSADLKEVQRWLAQAQSEVDRLSRITRPTLGLPRESAEPVAYRPADVLEEVLSFYAPEALLKKVEVQARLRTRRETYGVPAELRQVLSNLISNSLDAMRAGGALRLVLRESTDPGDSGRPGIRITVADTGNGIPGNILQQVFDPFFTTKGDTATGLGLWVSRQLVEKHGGRMRVRSGTSGPLTGTVFSIYLPLQIPDQEGSKRALVTMNNIVDTVQ